MTDIRKHGFESDTQWREYLAEIEEAATSSSPIEVRGPTVIQELADLRRQLSALREQVHARIPPQQSREKWWTIGAGALILLLMVLRPVRKSS
jgi:molybdopterin converting factor small subunit